MLLSIVKLECVMSFTVAKKMIKKKIIRTAAIHGCRAQAKEFPKGHLLEILAVSMAASCRFATDIKTVRD